MEKDKAEWVKPGLVARVRFLCGEEMLRHAKVEEVREGEVEEGAKLRSG
jgi:hypothetical protein